MSWRFVYNKIKKLLESEEFKKENSKWNPGQETSAINVALWHLLAEYPYMVGAKATQWGNDEWLDKQMQLEIKKYYEKSGVVKR